MFTTNTINKASKDMNSLLKQAQDLVRETGSATGERADALRKQSIQMLEAGIDKARDLEQAVLSTSRDMARSTNALVTENPWRAVAVSGVFGIGVGMIIGLSLAQRR